MSENARVRSIEALSRLRAAIGAFVEEAEQSLIAVDAEIARTQRVVGDEMPRFWRGELRKREEDVVRARVALEAALARRDAGKSSVDERKALARAKERVEIARARLAATKRWDRELERESLLYAGQVEPLSRFARGTAPRATEALRRMIDALEEYVSIAPATSEGFEEGSTEQPGGVGRGAGPASLSGAAPQAHPSPPASIRAMLPKPDEIEDATPGTATDLPPLALSHEERARLALLACGSAPDARHWLLVATGANDSARIGLHRAPASAPDDSGWRVVALEPRRGGTPIQWRKVPILAILRARPALLDLLRLPPEWTVVAAPGGEASILSVEGPDGNDRWSTIDEGPEKPDER